MSGPAGRMVVSIQSTRRCSATDSWLYRGCCISCCLRTTLQRQEPSQELVRGRRLLCSCWTQSSNPTQPASTFVALLSLTSMTICSKSALLPFPCLKAFYPSPKRGLIWSAESMFISSTISLSISSQSFLNKIIFLSVLKRGSQLDFPFERVWKRTFFNLRWILLHPQYLGHLVHNNQPFCLL